MTVLVKKSATYADLEAVPPNMVAEIIFGALVTHPRPAVRHGIAAGALASELTIPFQRGRGGPGGWIFMPEPEVHLGSHVLVPNIASWRRERLPADTEAAAFIETPPDWICEIISPSTEKYDKGDKRRIYATYGVPHLCHLDPRARTLETFQLQDGKWLLTNTFADSEGVCAPPFNEITFSLGLMWPLDPSSSDT